MILTSAPQLSIKSVRRKDECPLNPWRARQLSIRYLWRSCNQTSDQTRFSSNTFSTILGPGSEISARYALASVGQGKYPQFHAALMEDKTPEHQLAEPRILEMAASAGLDVERLKKLRSVCHYE